MPGRRWCRMTTRRMTAKNKRKALTGDIVFHDKSATCGYEVVSIVNKESIWMVLFPIYCRSFWNSCYFPTPGIVHEL